MRGVWRARRGRKSALYDSKSRQERAELYALWEARGGTRQPEARAAAGTPQLADGGHPRAASERGAELVRPPQQGQHESHRRVRKLPRAAAGRGRAQTRGERRIDKFKCLLPTERGKRARRRLARGQRRRCAELRTDLVVERVLHLEQLLHLELASELCLCLWGWWGAGGRADEASERKRMRGRGEPLYGSIARVRALLSPGVTRTTARACLREVSLKEYFKAQSSTSSVTTSCELLS